MRVNTGGGARTARRSTPEVPDKVVLARGARGELVRQLQVALKGAGSYKGTIDANFSDETAKAVAKFRVKHALGRDEIVNRETWRAVMGRSVPPLRERAIAVTAAFEGHGFGLAAGNYDGAGLTWGIIGFTLSSGNVPKLVLEAEARKPGCVAEAFGKKGPTRRHHERPEDAPVRMGERDQQRFDEEQGGRAVALVFPALRRDPGGAGDPVGARQRLLLPAGEEDRTRARPAKRARHRSLLRHSRPEREHQLDRAGTDPA